MAHCRAHDLAEFNRRYATGWVWRVSSAVG
jgi:hypothetical protein